MESIVEITVTFSCKVQPGSYSEDTLEDLQKSIQTQLEIHPQLYDVSIDDVTIENFEETDEDGCEPEEEES